MTSDLWTRLADLVPEALDLPPAERGAFLDTACRDATGTLDADLHREAETLVRASDAADATDRLRSPMSGLTSDIAQEEQIAGRALPRRIGSWEIGGVLGEGGMGVVYRASRADGVFDREVALKRLRAGQDPDLARRLDAERRTLARLEHDGIARLYDGGVDDDGAPFLVMEIVDGEPVTAHADRAGLDVRARVALFVRVCEAVAYAHRHLVVHRDLKPSNVFVTPDGSPKLLDFGVAKLLDDADDTETRFTLPGAMTPAYAAPEQVRGEAITTATDVYALGVLLYELLAGKRPYDLSGQTASDIERTVCESVPPPPSSVSDDARALRGDLDTIVARAMEKEPARRYATAEALADDLRRHLAGQPVTARPASRAYRARLFVRRHRAGVAGAVAVALALIVGIVATTWQARVARTEALRAEAAQTQAEGALGFLEETILVGDPQNSETDPLLSAVLDSASVRVDREADPSVAPLVHSMLSGVYLGRGETDRAAHHARLASQALEPAGGLRYATAQVHWGQALSDGGDPERSLVHYDAALAALGADAALDSPRASVLNAHAAALFSLSRYGEAEARYRQATAAARRAGDATIEVSALQNLAALMTETERSDEALGPLRRIIAVYSNSDDPEFTYGLPFAQVSFANALSNAERPAEALTAYRVGVASFESRLGADHPEAIAARVSMANHLTVMNRTADAAQVADEALAASQRTLPPDHPYAAYAQNVAGTALCNGDDPARGAALLASSQATRRTSLPAGHWVLANGESLLGACEARLGRTASGGRRLRASAAALTESLGADHPKARAATERFAAFNAGRR